MPFSNIANNSNLSSFQLLLAQLKSEGLYFSSEQNIKLPKCQQPPPSVISKVFSLLSFSFSNNKQEQKYQNYSKMPKKIWPVSKKNIVMITQGNTVSGYQILCKSQNQQSNKLIKFQHNKSISRNISLIFTNHMQQIISQIILSPILVQSNNNRRYGSQSQGQYFIIIYQNSNLISLFKINNQNNNKNAMLGSILTSKTFLNNNQGERNNINFDFKSINYYDKNTVNIQLLNQIRIKKQILALSWLNNHQFLVLNNKFQLLKYIIDKNCIKKQSIKYYEKTIQLNSPYSKLSFVKMFIKSNELQGNEQTYHHSNKITATIFYTVFDFSTNKGSLYVKQIPIQSSWNKSYDNNFINFFGGSTNEKYNISFDQIFESQQMQANELQYPYFDIVSQYSSQIKYYQQNNNNQQNLPSGQYFILKLKQQIFIITKHFQKYVILDNIIKNSSNNSNNRINTSQDQNYFNKSKRINSHQLNIFNNDKIIINILHLAMKNLNQKNSTNKDKLIMVFNDIPILCYLVKQNLQLWHFQIKNKKVKCKLIDVINLNLNQNNQKNIEEKGKQTKNEYKFISFFIIILNGKSQIIFIVDNGLNQISFLFVNKIDKISKLVERVSQFHSKKQLKTIHQLSTKLNVNKKSLYLKLWNQNPKNYTNLLQYLIQCQDLQTIHLQLQKYMRRKSIKINELNKVIQEIQNILLAKLIQQLDIKNLKWFLKTNFQRRKLNFYDFQTQITFKQFQSIYNSSIYQLIYKCIDRKIFPSKQGQQKIIYSNSKNQSDISKEKQLKINIQQVLQEFNILILENYQQFLLTLLNKYKFNLVKVLSKFHNLLPQHPYIIQGATQQLPKYENMQQNSFGKLQKDSQIIRTISSSLISVNNCQKPWFIPVTQTKWSRQKSSSNYIFRTLYPHYPTHQIQNLLQQFVSLQWTKQNKFIKHSFMNTTITEFNIKTSKFQGIYLYLIVCQFCNRICLNVKQKLQNKQQMTFQQIQYLKKRITQILHEKNTVKISKKSQGQSRRKSLVRVQSKTQTNQLNKLILMGIQQFNQSYIPSNLNYILSQLKPQSSSFLQIMKNYNNLTSQAYSHCLLYSKMHFLLLKSQILKPQTSIIQLINISPSSLIASFFLNNKQKDSQLFNEFMGLYQENNVQNFYNALSQFIKSQNCSKVELQILCEQLRNRNSPQYKQQNIHLANLLIYGFCSRTQVRQKLQINIFLQLFEQIFILFDQILKFQKIKVIQEQLVEIFQFFQCEKLTYQYVLNEPQNVLKKLIENYFQQSNKQFEQNDYQDQSRIMINSESAPDQSLILLQQNQQQQVEKQTNKNQKSQILCINSIPLNMDIISNTFYVLNYIRQKIYIQFQQKQFWLIYGRIMIEWSQFQALRQIFYSQGMNQEYSQSQISLQQIGLNLQVQKINKIRQFMLELVQGQLNKIYLSSQILMDQETLDHIKNILSLLNQSQTFAIGLNSSSNLMQIQQFLIKQNAKIQLSQKFSQWKYNIKALTLSQIAYKWSSLESQPQDRIELFEQIMDYCIQYFNLDEMLNLYRILEKIKHGKQSCELRTNQTIQLAEALIKKLIKREKSNIQQFNKLNQFDNQICQIVYFINKGENHQIVQYKLITGIFLRINHKKYGKYIYIRNQDEQIEQEMINRNFQRKSLHPLNNKYLKSPSKNYNNQKFYKNKIVKIPDFKHRLDDSNMYQSNYNPNDKSQDNLSLNSKNQSIIDSTNKVNKFNSRIGTNSRGQSTTLRNFQSPSNQKNSVKFGDPVISQKIYNLWYRQGKKQEICYNVNINSQLKPNSENNFLITFNQNPSSLIQKDSSFINFVKYIKKTEQNYLQSGRKLIEYFIFQQFHHQNVQGQRKISNNQINQLFKSSFQNDNIWINANYNQHNKIQNNHNPKQYFLTDYINLSQLWQICYSVTLLYMKSYIQILKLKSLNEPNEYSENYQFNQKQRKKQNLEDQKAKIFINLYQKFTQILFSNYYFILIAFLKSQSIKLLNGIEQYEHFLLYEIIKQTQKYIQSKILNKGNEFNNYQQFLNNQQNNQKSIQIKSIQDILIIWKNIFIGLKQILIFKIEQLQPTIQFDSINDKMKTKNISYKTNMNDSPGFLNIKFYPNNYKKQLQKNSHNLIVNYTNDNYSNIDLKIIQQILLQINSNGNKIKLSNKNTSLYIKMLKQIQNYIQKQKQKLHLKQQEEKEKNLNLKRKFEEANNMMKSSVFMQTNNNKKRHQSVMTIKRVSELRNSISQIMISKDASNPCISGQFNQLSNSITNQLQNLNSYPNCYEFSGLKLTKDIGDAIKQIMEDQNHNRQNTPQNNKNSLQKLTENVIVSKMRQKKSGSFNNNINFGSISNLSNNMINSISFNNILNNVVTPHSKIFQTQNDKISQQNQAKIIQSVSSQNINENKKIFFKKLQYYNQYQSEEQKKSYDSYRLSQNSNLTQKMNNKIVNQENSFQILDEKIKYQYKYEQKVQLENKIPYYNIFVNQIELLEKLRSIDKQFKDYISLVESQENNQKQTEQRDILSDPLITRFKLFIKYVSQYQSFLAKESSHYQSQTVKKIKKIFTASQIQKFINQLFFTFSSNLVTLTHKQILTYKSKKQKGIICIEDKYKMMKFSIVVKLLEELGLIIYEQKEIQNKSKFSQTIQKYQNQIIQQGMRRIQQKINKLQVKDQKINNRLLPTKTIAFQKEKQRLKQQFNFNIISQLKFIFKFNDLIIFQKNDFKLIDEIKNIQRFMLRIQQYLSEKTKNQHNILQTKMEIIKRIIKITNTLYGRQNEKIINAVCTLLLFIFFKQYSHKSQQQLLEQVFLIKNQNNISILTIENQLQQIIQFLLQSCERQYLIDLTQLCQQQLFKKMNYTNIFCQKLQNLFNIKILKLSTQN